MSKARMIALGNERFEIRDNGIPSVFADLIIESRLMGEFVSLSLATLVIEGDIEAGNRPEALVAARLRMPLPAVRVVHSQLSLLLEHAEQRAIGEKTRQSAAALT